MFRAGSQNQWVRFTARSQRPTVPEEQRRGFIWKKEIGKSLEQQMKLLECALPSLLLEFSTPRVASSFSPTQPSSTVLLSSVEFLWLPPYISPHFTSTLHVTINNSKPRIPFSSYAYYFFSIRLLLISLPTSYSLIPWYIAIIRPCLFLTSLSVLTLLSQPQLWFNSTPLPSRGAIERPKESFWSVWGQSVMTGLIVTRKPCYTPPSDNLHFFLVIFNTPSLNHSTDCLVTSYFTDKIEVIRRKLFYLIFICLIPPSCLTCLNKSHLLFLIQYMNWFHSSENLSRILLIPSWLFKDFASLTFPYILCLISFKLHLWRNIRFIFHLPELHVPFLLSVSLFLFVNEIFEQFLWKLAHYLMSWFSKFSRRKVQFNNEDIV